MANLSPWNSPGVANVLRPGVVTGDVFYVDGNNGDDTAGIPGTDPAAPLATITRAHALCTSGNNDHIIVLDYPEAGDIETMPISITKDRVHVLGSAYAHERGDKFIFLCCGTTDTGVFSIEARGIEIAYFKLASGTDDPAIIFAGAGVASKAAAIHHNTFGQKNCPLGASQTGIDWGGASDGNWGYVGYNFFGSSLTGNGILIAANPAHVRIEHNVFYHIPGIAILNSGDGNFGVILNNQFSLTEDTVGMAITFTNAAAGEGWFIDGNSANFGVTAMAANPYRDLSVGAAKQDWGNNYKGNTHVMPAVA